VKRAATLVLVMLAMSASAAVDARALALEGQKTQWAPTRNSSELNARAVFADESRRAASPYAGEGGATAAGSGEARYYDSKLGIFLSRDSYEGVLGEAPSLHRFSYAGNRPLKYVDPSGRCFFQSCAEMLFGDDDAAEGPQPDAPVDVVAPKGTPGEMSLSEQAETAKTTKAMTSAEDRSRLMTNASLDEVLMYDYGELLGGNSMARAGTGEDETGRKLSRLERAENAFDATSKVVEAALIAETGGELLLERTAAKTAAQQGLKQAARAEKTAVEAERVVGAKVAPSSPAGASGFSLHPKSLAARSTKVSEQSVMSALREAGTPEAHATAKYLKRGLAKLEFQATSPVGAAGLAPFGTDRAVVFLDQVTTAADAASVAAHEVRHVMQRLPASGAGYSLIHEVDAFMWQSRAGGASMTTNEIMKIIQSNPKLYGSFLK
jgi:RHS repeat-associated protein